MNSPEDLSNPLHIREQRISHIKPPKATVPQPSFGGAPQPVDNPFNNYGTRVISVASGKGGVGKSSITANLAIALAQQGKRVGVIDADVWGFSMPRMLGITHPPDVEGDQIIPPVAHGVSLISMGYFAKEDQPVIWRGPMLHKALKQFITDVKWDDPEYLLIDMPPGTGDVSLSIAQFLPKAELIAVTTPQIAAQSVAQRAALMTDKVKIKLTGVIENMSYFIGDDGKRYELFGTGGGQALATKLNVPLLGQVPLIPKLREGSDSGKPIMVIDPDSPASQEIYNIAKTLIDTYQLEETTPEELQSTS